MKNVSNKEKLQTEQKEFEIIVNTIADKLGFDSLPPEIMISTMTMTCKIDIQFNCRNISKYVDLSFGGILSVKCGKENDKRTNRSLLPKKQKTGKKKKKKNVFYNQVSMYVMVKGKKKKPVSVKLFLNGSIQITGCKTVGNAIEALKKIFVELYKIKATIISKNYELKVVEHQFVSNRELLNIKYLKEIKVQMINSNFEINFKIDRAKLHQHMSDDQFEVSFDPEKHACVNIKYDNPEKTISIFVFEGGSIIITGVRNCHQIVDAYNFINRYLLTNYPKIVKNDNLTNTNIIKYLDKENIRENINNSFENDDVLSNSSDQSNICEFNVDTDDIISINKNKNTNISKILSQQH